MKSFRDLEELAKQELRDEMIDQKKELLKERLREIRHAKKVMIRLEKQYTELLDAPLDDIDDLDEE